MELSRKLAMHSLRVSFSRAATDAEVEIFASELSGVVPPLRA